MADLQMLAILLLAPAILSIPIDSKVDTIDEYRLPSIYKPSNYNLSINVPSESLTEKNSSNFMGNVTITFSVTEETNYVILHAHHEFIVINKVTIKNLDMDPSDYSINEKTDILTIDCTATGALVVNRNYELIVEYTAKLSLSDMYGFYKSSYVDAKNVTKYLATTQFEPTHARRAFPCFDEPSFKATFDVTISYPSEFNVLFNTEAVKTTPSDDKKTTTVVHKQTPRMSTYLIAFIVSEFTCTTGKSIEDDKVPYKVCSREEAKATRDFAVEIGPQLLTALNTFTGYNYGSEMSKMDQVAIPDFAAGAMENWGLVTYRETALLWNEDESSNRYKQRVATVIAHEFAHQWFGNLVTCKWWSETFLNEGFATYFEYHITKEVLPDWELEKQFVIDTHQAVLESDALENAQSLVSNASTPAEISGKFGTISYSKGGSILRMLEHILTLANFKKGLQDYLQQMKTDSAEPEDLWTILEGNIGTDVNLPAKLATVMENWINKPGFPLLTVTRNATTAKVTQERFLVSGKDAESKWYVPVSYSSSAERVMFESTIPKGWLTPDKEELLIPVAPSAKWIILNNQETAYYRVNYDDELWTNISEALKLSNFSDIPDINRAQIVDDLFSLAKINKVPYSKAFSVIEFLQNDTSYYPWTPAFSGFNFLLRRVGDNSILGQNISAHVSSLMGNLSKSVPITDIKENDQVYTHKQVLALTWACRLGKEDCVKEVKSLFSEFKKAPDTKRPNKNLRTIVYCNALRYSDDAKSDWDFLWDIYKGTDIATEQVTVLTALGCTKDEDLLNDYLTKSITEDSGIRSQDALSVFSAVYGGNSEGVDVAFEFLKKNYEKISERYNSMNSLGNLIKGIAERFTTQEQINNLESFIKTGNLPEEFKISANEALETAKANQDWLKEFNDDLRDYYGLENSSGQIKTSLYMTLLTLVVFKLFN